MYILLILVTSFTFVWGKSDSAQLSPAQQIIAGGAAGAATATVVQPLVFIKNQLQQRHGLKEIRATFAQELEQLHKQLDSLHRQNKLSTLNYKMLNHAAAAVAPVKVLYRGYPVFAGSYIPVTAVQFMVAGQLTTLAGNRELNAKEQLAVSALAGAASTVVAGPAELAMLHQQNSGLSLWRTTQKLVAQHGARVLTRGIGITAVRKAGFTIGYAAIYPLLKQWATNVDGGNYKLFAPTIATVGAGIATIALTHPLDVVKTGIQEDVARQKYRTMWDAIWKTYKADGIKGFTPGIYARGPAVFFAVSNLGYFKEKITDLMIKHNQKSQSKERIA
jgi:hypothetical protein